MKKIDKINLEFPTWGSRKIRDYLRLNVKDLKINRKRVQRLMRKMAICAIYPKKRLSTPDMSRCVFPYLLRNLIIDKPNQVWCTDITYIPLKSGFVYLVAVIDWYSKKILSWELSTSMDKHFCIWALDEALRNYNHPKIFNTDQGSQFTSEAFVTPLLEKNIRISMDGKGRATDNIAIERFWRTLKYDEVYLKEYESVDDARKNIFGFIEKYNNERPHQTLEGITPDMAYNKIKKVA